jgi:protein O-GlcNAc transferase
VIDWLRKALAFASSGKLAADAFSAHDAGDWARAVPLLEALAAKRPADAETHYRLGDALYQLDRPADALAPLERAIGISGAAPDSYYKLGNALKDLDRPEEALARYRRALELDPRHARALVNTGVILESRDRKEEALDCYRRAVQADPSLVPAHSNLAVLLHHMDRLAEAAEAYQPLLRLTPGSVTDLCNLGNAYQGLGRYDEAVQCYERALAVDPRLADAMRRSGVALLGSGKHKEAEAALRRASEVEPEHVGAWVNLGDSLQYQHRYDDALRAYERGLLVNPDLPELLNNIGAAYRGKGDLKTAQRYFERALEASPALSSARINVANTRYSLGFIDEAIEQHREIVKRDPESMSAARQILMILLYKPGLSPEALFAEHRDFAERYGYRGPLPPAPERRRAGGKIRIGYLSSDFRRHPVGYNMMPVIAHHDRRTFEVYLYSCSKAADELTRQFRERADVWRSITYMPDETAARVIREDELDILVLLAGRFDDNRPLLATHRLAPVQVSMHDPATSGLEQIDYLIADRGLSPRDTAERFTERVTCLPTFYLHAPLRELPPPAPPPVERNGWITFGSFNNPAKVNPAVVALWAQVLRSVPGSKLLLKYMDVFSVDEVRSRYLRLFEGHGVGPDRVVLPGEGSQSRGQHLARYGEIDIALDTFPFSGSTTTFEALSMGVPVITLAGDRMVSRWSAAMLRKVGLSRLVARTEEEYVELARSLAADPGALARLRAELRERVPRSPLCAEGQRVRQLERLYRAMWALHVRGGKKVQQP